MVPGEHVVIVGGPLDALAARSEGLQLRDTLTILLPHGSVLMAFLFRVPLEGTVAENVLAHGVGGLWIDGCRVTANGPSPSLKHRATARRTGVTPISGSKAKDAQARGRIERRGSPEAYKSDHAGEHLGRWPTNLLLVHGSGCVWMGDKRAKGSHSLGANPKKYSINRQVYSGIGDRTPSSFVGSDGLEAVQAWNCCPGCPVSWLDTQSGNIISTKVPSHLSYDTGPGGYHGAGGFRLPTNSYGDAGGASRFYPQFASLAGALDWMVRLVGGS